MDILPADEQGIGRALTVIREGGIVAHATETCYGFACDVSDLGAVANLFVLKNRPYSSPVSVLFLSVEDAKKYAEWNDEAEALAKKHLPGPLTLILPLRADAPLQLYVTPLLSDRSPLTAGVRVSSRPLALRLVTDFGKPLSTTSANFHGFPNPYSAEEIVAQFKHQPIQPDLILDSGTLPHVPPSTVLDVTKGRGQANIRRKGGI
ncbi:MAG: L-threonylcarbamoyladenylate synthase [Candidatus Peribacteraceae bacterium]|jgi:L-threonylcarbamoyladenylate synthase